MITVDDAKEFAKYAVAVLVPLIGLLRERTKLDIVHARLRAKETGRPVRDVMRKRKYHALFRGVIRKATNQEVSACPETKDPPMSKS